MKNLFQNKNKKKSTIVFVSLFFLVVFAFVYTGTLGNQSISAKYASVGFSGHVKIADGEWKPYKKGEHIPSTNKDVTLKGKFEIIAPDSGEKFGTPTEGTPIAFYLNHIGCEISEDGGEKYVFDTEIDFAGQDLCGVMCIGYYYNGGDQVTITLKNPHKFGNETAVDDFLSHLSVYGGANYEKDMMRLGNTKRTFGITFVLFAFMILGTAVFSMCIRAPGSKKFWAAGAAVLFAGTYFLFDAQGVMYWSETVKLNTRALGGSIMLYMLSATAFCTLFLKGTAKKAGNILLLLLLISDSVCFAVPMMTNTKFYDTLPAWVVVQSLVCICMMCMFVYRAFKETKYEKIQYLPGIFIMLAFFVDVCGTLFGKWQGGFVSEVVFVIVFAIALVAFLGVIPKSRKAETKTKELEHEKKMLKDELAESRIATMISQIQPHFIYNTLGTIEQLCLSSPEEASKLVHNFSLYLRGNFSELDNSKPIRFSQEMNHVKHYTDIEQVRFPDMTIQYDLRSVEFVLPALSVQPLVENAIKHGLMGLEQGGIVMISAYETDTHYIVEVKDDGVGFDSKAGYDETKHVGIKNIRGRIEAMCSGTLTVESSPGKGTVATIRIPKEAVKGDSDNG